MPNLFETSHDNGIFGTKSVPTDGSAQSMSAWARDAASKLSAEFAAHSPVHPTTSLLFASTIGTPEPDPSRIEGRHGGRAKVGEQSISKSNGVAALLNPLAGLPNAAEKEIPHRGRTSAPAARTEQSSGVAAVLKAEALSPAEREEPRTEGRRLSDAVARQYRHGVAQEPKGTRKAAVPPPAVAEVGVLHYQTASGAPAYLKPGPRPAPGQPNNLKMSSDWFSDPAPGARDAPAAPAERREPSRAPWGQADDVPATPAARVSSSSPASAVEGASPAAARVPALDLTRTNAPVGRSRAMAKALLADESLGRAAGALAIAPSASPPAGAPTALLSERTKPEASTKAHVQPPAGSKPSTAHAMRPDLPAPAPAETVAYLRKAERDPTAAGGAAAAGAVEHRPARAKGAFSQAPSLISPFDQPERAPSDPLATRPLPQAQRAAHSRPASAQVDDRFITSSMASHAAMQRARESEHL